MTTPTLRRLVFPDESGANTNLTRRYGRAFGKERVKNCVPLNKAKTTILSPVPLDGSVAYATYSGGTTGDKFIKYLEETLIPALRLRDIVLWIICEPVILKRRGGFCRKPEQCRRVFPHTVPTSI